MGKQRSYPGRFGGIRRRRSRAGTLAALATPMIAALALAAVPAGALADGPAPPRAPKPKPTPTVKYATIKAVCPKATPGHPTCQALQLVPASSATPGAEAYTPGAGAVAGLGPAGGLSPGLLASAYGYAQTGGTGQTVGIVDAFNDPNIFADLATFDTNYGLAACTKANGCLKVVSQTGSTTSLPADDTTGWSIEESLDIEAVHSVCPLCKILLVEANSQSNDDLAAAVNEAVALGATEVSNSYGGSESFGDITATDEAAYKHAGIPILASTADNGYFDFDTAVGEDTILSAPDWPASYPGVIAVGGTTLKLNQTGTRAGEEVWDSDGPKDQYQLDFGLTGGTGGGCSTLFGAPPWQLNVTNWTLTECGTSRLDADISAVADPFTGFDIYDSYDYCDGGCEPDWATYGGTSLSSPIIAAMYALAGGGHGIAYPALTLYGHLTTNPSTTLFDVTQGGNGWCGGEGAAQCGDPNTLGEGVLDCDYPASGSTPSAGTLACDAGVGYDGPSGVGTPVGLGAFAPLAPTAVITLPGASIPVNTTETFSGSHSTSPFPRGTISSYSWNWGDGSALSTGVSPTHKYTTTGTFTVKLTVTDNYGVVGSTTASEVVTGGS